MYHGEGRQDGKTHLASIDVKPAAFFMSDGVIFNVALTIMGAIAGVDKLFTVMARSHTYE